MPLLPVRTWFCWVGLYCRSKVPLLWSFQWSTEQVTLHACLVEYAWSRLEPRASTRAHEALRGPAWSRGPPDLASRRQAWSSLSCSCYYSLLLHLPPLPSSSLPSPYSLLPGVVGSVPSACRVSSLRWSERRPVRGLSPSRFHRCLPRLLAHTAVRFVAPSFCPIPLAHFDACVSYVCLCCPSDSHSITFSRFTVNI